MPRGMLKERYGSPAAGELRGSKSDSWILTSHPGVAPAGATTAAARLVPWTGSHSCQPA